MNNSVVVCRFTVQERMTFGCTLLFKVCWRREAFSLCGGVMAWMLPKWCRKWPSSSWPMNRYVDMFVFIWEQQRLCLLLMSFRFSVLLYFVNICFLNFACKIVNSKARCCHVNSCVTVSCGVPWHFSCIDILFPDMTSQYCDIIYKWLASWHCLPLAFTHCSQNVNLPNS